MLIMSTVLKKANKEGVYLLYIDSQNQHYFLFLAIFIANYKKQVIFTGIKSSYKYLTYYIYTNKQYNLITAI